MRVYAVVKTTRSWTNIRCLLHGEYSRTILTDEYIYSNIRKRTNERSEKWVFWYHSTTKKKNSNKGLSVAQFNYWCGHFYRATTTNKELQSQQNELETKAIPDWNPAINLKNSKLEILWVAPRIKCGPIDWLNWLLNYSDAETSHVCHTLCEASSCRWHRKYLSAFQSAVRQ